MQHSLELIKLRDEYLEKPLSFKHYVSFTKENGWWCVREKKKLPVLYKSKTRKMAEFKVFKLEMIERGIEG